MTWLKARSWHILRTWTRVPGQGKALCGRTIKGDGQDAYPPDERTCESCWRINAKKERT